MRTNKIRPVNGYKPLPNGALTRKRVISDLRSIGFEVPIISRTISKLRRLSPDTYQSYLGLFERIYEPLEMSPMTLYLYLPKVHELNWMAKNMDLLFEKRDLITSNFVNSKKRMLDLSRLPELFRDLMKQNSSQV